MEDWYTKIIGKLYTELFASWEKVEELTREVQALQHKLDCEVQALQHRSDEAPFVRLLTKEEFEMAKAGRVKAVKAYRQRAEDMSGYIPSLRESVDVVNDAKKYETYQEYAQMES